MTYEALIEEKEKLLKDKKENEAKIREIDSKIQYYEFLYSNCLTNIRIHKENITNYNKIMKYEKRSKTLFDMSGMFRLPSISDYCVNRIIDFETEIKKLEKDADRIQQTLDIYIALKKYIIDENEEKSFRIEEIDLSIGSKEKVLTKGEIQ